MEKEIYKDIPGYEGLYQVSNFGNVISFINNHGNLYKIPKHVSNNGNNSGNNRSKKRTKK